MTKSLFIVLIGASLLLPRPKVRRVQRLRSEVHGVAEMPRALQLSNLIACVVRDYLLIIARPFCCSPAVWP